MGILFTPTQHMLPPLPLQQYYKMRHVKWWYYNLIYHNFCTIVDMSVRLVGKCLLTFSSDTSVSLLVYLCRKVMHLYQPTIRATDEQHTHSHCIYPHPHTHIHTQSEITAGH